MRRCPVRLDLKKAGEDTGRGVANVNTETRTSQGDGAQ